jgi:hypothetical protein
MTEWTFRLTLRGIELTDEQLDALYGAGCDDGSFSVEPDDTILGGTVALSDRPTGAGSAADPKPHSKPLDARFVTALRDPRGPFLPVLEHGEAPFALMQQCPCSWPTLLQLLGPNADQRKTVRETTIVSSSSCTSSSRIQTP